ncbi:universal stress protein [Pontibacter ummariensis]|nr:universal stress protein [Pontibacter ummariensis]
MKKILVPIDYSSDSQNALLYALDLAHVLKANIVLVHAFYQPLSFPYSQDFTSVVNALEKEKAAELEAYAAKVKGALLEDFSLQFHSTVGAEKEVVSGLPVTKEGFHTVEIERAPAARAEVEVRCIAKYGFAADEIVKAVDVQQADMVVMGMRGIGGIHLALLGRTALSVIRDVQVPVFAIPKAARYKGLKSVVFAADLAKSPAVAVLDSLRDYLKAFRSTLQVLYLYSKDQQQAEQEKSLAALEDMGKAFSDLDYRVTFQQREDTAEAIKQFIQEQQADLLVLAPQKRGFLEDLLNKSVTQRMMAKTFIPLLALPPLPR